MAGTVALVGIWAVLAALSVQKTHSVRIQAEHFLADIVQLQVGTSTVEQVAPLAAKYHGEWKPSNAPYGPPASIISSIRSYFRISDNTSSRIPGASCRVGFNFDNRWQHWMCFSPLTTFGATVFIRNNLLVHMIVGLDTFQNVDSYSAVVVEEFRKGQRDSEFSSRVNPAVAIVCLTPGSTPAQRTAAYSINIGCLTKLRGCRDTREMAPAIPQGIQ